MSFVHSVEEASATGAGPTADETARCKTSPLLTRRRIVILIAGLLVLVAAFWLLPSRRWVIDAYHWIRHLDRREGFIVFVAVYALLSAVGLPTSPLNVGAGLLFGLLFGFLASMAGVMAASILCFVIARYIARDWLLRRLQCRPKFAAVLNALRQESWRIILLTRLNPLLPAAVSSYCFGVTSISFRSYLAASLIGNIPLCLALAYLGSAGQLAIGRHNYSSWDYVLWGLGFVATIALTLWVARFTKRKLKQYSDESSMPSPNPPPARLEHLS